MLKMFGWFFSRLALFATTVLLVVFTWFADANLVNDAFDMNRWISEETAALLDSSGRLKTAFRFINMERVLLIMEIMAALFGLAIYIRSRAQRLYTRIRASRQDPLPQKDPLEKPRYPSPDATVPPAPRAPPPQR